MAAFAAEMVHYLIMPAGRGRHVSRVDRVCKAKNHLVWIALVRILNRWFAPAPDVWNEAQSFADVIILRPHEPLSGPARFSFALMVALVVLAAWLRLGPLLLATLFSFLALEMLTFRGRKWLALLLYGVAIAAFILGLVRFINQAVVTLPALARTTIPSLVAFAQQHGKELSFTDWDTLKTTAIDAVINGAHYLTNVASFAQATTRVLIQLIVGAVVAINLFINNKLQLDAAPRNNLYTACCEEIASRFRTLYQSFAVVMGAQLIISIVNTALTGLYLMVMSLPHHIVLLGVTFICGLLPIVGNLISNTVIVAVAFTVSPGAAISALIFLVVIHKLEYFLNSKIIGDRIKNPIWLTLLGLVVGELIMGIPGMILAPVVLHYLKVESSRLEFVGRSVKRRTDDRPAEMADAAR
jgi:predicted PurR-regulated permease PerM